MEEGVGAFTCLLYFIVNEIITEAEEAKERITKEHAVTLMPASLRSCPNVLHHIEMTWRECLGWIIAQ